MGVCLFMYVMVNVTNDVLFYFQLQTAHFFNPIDHGKIIFKTGAKTLLIVDMYNGNEILNLSSH